MCDQIHVFERAGLGKAPFRYAGFEVKLHCVPGGYPKAGASCDFCGTAIANCFWIQSADGRRFKVGSDCVAKTGDEGLRKVVGNVARKHERDARHAREEAKIADGKAWVEEHREALAKHPHPNAYLARDGKTLADWVDYMWRMAGNSGKLRVIATCRKVLA